MERARVGDGGGGDAYPESSRSHAGCCWTTGPKGTGSECLAYSALMSERRRRRARLRNRNCTLQSQLYSQANPVIDPPLSCFCPATRQRQSDARTRLLLLHARAPRNRERQAALDTNTIMPPDRTHHPAQEQQQHSTAQRFSEAINTGMPMSSVGPTHPPSLERGRACLTCRRRRVKCDGARPVCGRCSKSARAHGE